MPPKQPSCILSLIAGSFLYTQLDSLRMMRNLYDYKSSMYLTPVSLGNENASVQSFQNISYNDVIWLWGLFLIIFYVLYPGRFPFGGIHWLHRLFHRVEDNVPHTFLFVCLSHCIPTTCTPTNLLHVPIKFCIPSHHFEVKLINVLSICLPGLYSTFPLQPMAVLVVGISPSQRKSNKRAGVWPSPRVISSETVWGALPSHRT